MNNTRNEKPTLEILLASLYYLMTRHARLPDARISRSIIEHFDMLATHPDCKSEILIKAGERLASQWTEHLLGEASDIDFHLNSNCAKQPNKIH